MLFFFSGCESFEEEYKLPGYKNPVKIGVVGDVSASRGQIESMFFGAHLAAEEINTKGGLILNDEYSDLELIFKNSGANPEKGVLAVQELMNEGVNIVIGPTYSASAIEMAEYCIKNNVLMMSYGATTPELSMLEDNDFIWRTCPSDLTLGTISAKYCKDSLKTSRAAILYRNDRFGRGLSEVISDVYTNIGGVIVNKVSFPSDLTELSSFDITYELNSIIDDSVDLIFIIAVTSDLSILTNKIYNNSKYSSLDKKPYLFLNDGVVAEELVTNLNPELLETIIGITSIKVDNENYLKFKTNYTERFGFSPSTYSENTYDAVYLMVYGMLRANSSDPLLVKNYLREVSGISSSADNQIVIDVGEYEIAKNILKKGGVIDYEGASGSIDFDENGDPKPNIAIWKIVEGKTEEISFY